MLAEKIQKDFDAVAFKNDLGFNDKFVITYVGAHGVANHLIQLIEAAEKLQDTNIVFQLIGSGMCKRFLVEEVKKRKLSNVIFRDQVSKQEVFKYILASDVGVSVLKKIDTFKTIYSNKTFDYMSCKIPILIAIDGVSRELVNDAKCGVYVEPENIDSIVNGVRELANKSTEEIQHMGENGYIFAKGHFDRLLLAKEYTNKIQEILK